VKEVTDPELLKQLEAQPVTDPAILAQLEGPPQSESAIRGAIQGVTLGAADELAGFTEKYGNSTGEKLRPDGTRYGPKGTKSAGSALWNWMRGTPPGTDADYTRARDEMRSANEAAQTANPGMFLLGNVGGGIAATAPFLPAMTGATLGSTAARSGVVSGLLGAAQGAGDAPEAADIPDYAKVGAGVGGALGAAVPLALGGVGRMVSAKVDPTHKAMVDALTREGVETSAGQKTSSKFVKYLESTADTMPFSGGGISNLMDRQKEQFTKAAMKRIGSDADRALPGEVSAAKDAITGQFKELSERNVLAFDRQAATDLVKVAQSYDFQVLPEHQKKFIADTINGIVNNGPIMQGQMYQSMRSDLTKLAKGDGTPFGTAVRGLRDTLDDAMERTLKTVNPDDAGKWGEARKLYGNYKIMEKALSGAGEDTAKGLLSPSQLRTATKTANAGRYVTGKGDFAELARAGEAVLKPLPQSGTQPRQLSEKLLTGLAPAIAGGGVGYSQTGSPEGAFMGAAGGAGLARLLLSGPGQALLANQAMAGAGGPGRRAVEALMALPARDELAKRLRGPNAGR
jgi:hypothetical protein